MRKFLVSLGLVAVLALGAGATSFTGAQETEGPTELGASCASPQASPEVAGTPGEATPEANATLDAAVIPDDVTEIGPDASSPEATPGTPDATPGESTCATPEATPNV